MRRLLSFVLLTFCLTLCCYGLGESPGLAGLPVLPRVDLTVLVENMAGGGPVLGEWGLAYLIEVGKHRILMDTGNGLTLLENARVLEVDLDRLDAIVISHSHSDHTGGLSKVLEACGRVDLFVHPDVFAGRYFREGTRAVKEEWAIPRDQLRRRIRELRETTRPTPICEGVVVTGQVPRVTGFEDTGLRGSVFLDPDMKKEDIVLDDQAIFFRVPEGLVVLLGCAHAGVVNTLEYAARLVGEQKIYAVMGGTHLISASPDRMAKTIEAFRKFGIQRIMLSHCTGVDAYAQLAAAFPGRCSWPAAGSQIRFGGQHREAATDGGELSVKSRKTIRMEEMTWPEIKQAIESGFKTAVFAVGSTEQHGPHLPEMTDARIGEDVGERIARKLGNALQARTVDVGISEHHLAFAGTISLKPETLSLVLRDYVDSLARHGFTRVVIIPTHGGNFATVRQAIAAARTNHPGLEVIAFTEVLALTGFLERLSVEHGVSAEEAGAHAGESETSMMLALEGDLVKTDRFASGYLGPFGEAESKLLFEKGMRALSANGVLGDPRKASAAKGEGYLEGLADFIISELRLKPAH